VTPSSLLDVHGVFIADCDVVQGRFLPKVGAKTTKLHGVIGYKVTLYITAMSTRKLFHHVLLPSNLFS
jgi:hypothetical protein